jgi:hypothetical protein
VSPTQSSIAGTGGGSPGRFQLTHSPSRAAPRMTKMWWSWPLSAAVSISQSRARSSTSGTGSTDQGMMRPVTSVAEAANSAASLSQTAANSATPAWPGGR